MNDDVSLCTCLSSMEDFYPSKNHGPDSGIGSDNGDKRLSTTEVFTHKYVYYLFANKFIQWMLRVRCQAGVYYQYTLNGARLKILPWFCVNVKLHTKIFLG